MQSLEHTFDQNWGIPTGNKELTVMPGNGLVAEESTTSHVGNTRCILRISLLLQLAEEHIV